MEIIRAIWRHLVTLLILNLILVPFMTLAPVGFFVLPLVMIARNPHDDFSGLAQFFFWTGPLSCALWMLLSCHWQSVRHWQRMGRLDTWRQDHGGLVRTVTKATGYMFGGLFASFFFEMVFLCVFRFAPYSLFGSASRFALWFALFPFATFAPVILLWLVRWRRGRRERLSARSLYSKDSYSEVAQ
jgi:hypothetical protein